VAHEKFANFSEKSHITAKEQGISREFQAVVRKSAATLDLAILLKGLEKRTGN
jgi:hypothetical protein